MLPLSDEEKQSHCKGVWEGMGSVIVAIFVKSTAYQLLPPRFQSPPRLFLSHSTSCWFRFTL